MEAAQIQEVDVIDDDEDSETVFVRVTTAVALAEELFVRIRLETQPAR